MCQLRRSRRLRRPSFSGAALVILLLALASCASPTADGATPSPPQSVASAKASPGPTPSESARPSTSAAGVPTATPLALGSAAPELIQGTELPLDRLLALLVTAPEDRTGYQRDLFRHWIDADGDGCDTRREVLIAEAIVAPTIGGGCTLTGGEWLSAYDGLVFTDASQLQIDHVVALAEAWDSGASAWSADRRMRFANDLDVPWALIAVSSASNQSKSDHDPAEWLPPDPTDLCPFVSAWIAIKVRWQLSVDQLERIALDGLVGDCPRAEMPYDPAPPDAAGAPTPPPSAATCSPAYPTVCIPPPPPDLNCGDIPYRRFVVLAPDPHHFDGDHDGIGCES